MPRIFINTCGPELIKYLGGNEAAEQRSVHDLPQSKYRCHLWRCIPEKDHSYCSWRGMIVAVLCSDTRTELILPRDKGQQRVYDWSQKRCSAYVKLKREQAQLR